MKKISLFVIGAACLLTAGCATMGTGAGNGNVLGNVLGSIVNGGSITNVITSVIGLDKVNAQQLVGSWRYTGPGVAFTTENLLAKAGGEVAARQIEEKLREQYDKVGISSANTFITFTNDNTFEGKVDGKPLSGTYTLDEKTGALKLKTLLLTLNGYVKRSGLNGISIVFESKKLLSVLQTLAAMSGNSSIEAIGTISKNYDGIRVGFNMGR